MTRLYILRHGETEWNKQNRTQGCSNDLSLSDYGRNQVKEVANRFKNILVDTLYSSDLKRAYETADEISKIVNQPVNKTLSLREMNFGCWEGLTSQEIGIKYKDIYEIWHSNPLNANIPDAESLIELQKRVLRFINDIILKHKDKNIVIVSHGITIKIMIFSILGIDLSFNNRIRIDNTGISIIDYYNSQSVLTLLNDTSHLVGSHVSRRSHLS